MAGIAVPSVSDIVTVVAIGSPRASQIAPYSAGTERTAEAMKPL